MTTKTFDPGLVQARLAAAKNWQEFAALVAQIEREQAADARLSAVVEARRLAWACADDACRRAAKDGSARPLAEAHAAALAILGPCADGEARRQIGKYGFRALDRAAIRNVLDAAWARALAAASGIVEGAHGA